MEYGEIAVIFTKCSYSDYPEVQYRAKDLDQTNVSYVGKRKIR